MLRCIRVSLPLNILITFAVATLCASGCGAKSGDSHGPAPDLPGPGADPTPAKFEDLLEAVAPGFQNDGTIEGLEDRIKDLDSRYFKMSHMRSPSAWTNDLGDHEAPKGEVVTAGASCEPLLSVFVSAYNTVWMTESAYIGFSGKTILDEIVTPHTDLPPHAATVFDLAREKLEKDGSISTIHIGTSGTRTLWAEVNVEHDTKGTVEKNDICVYLFDGDAATLKAKCSYWSRRDTVSRIDTEIGDSFKPGAFTNEFSYQITLKDTVRSFKTASQQIGPLTARYVVDNTQGITREKAGMLGALFWPFQKVDADLEFKEEPSYVGDRSLSCKIGVVRELK